ncbi:hypothetical protein U9M48_004433 [Paspalum notatum var. saurae]|uniref:O-methyltransferase ZRP4 n=1 Tax=Paspalum notatum var. saurae TaxID=547442 RepID=A0AAQ3PKI0_PASNO
MMYLDKFAASTTTTMGLCAWFPTTTATRRLPPPHQLHNPFCLERGVERTWWCAGLEEAVADPRWRWRGRRDRRRGGREEASRLGPICQGEKKGGTGRVSMPPCTAHELDCASTPSPSITVMRSRGGRRRMKEMCVTASSNATLDILHYISGTMAPESLAWHHGLFHIKSSALLCVVGLGIPSSIHRRGGAATIPDIVIDTGVHPSKLAYLRRLMRMLSFCGVFTSEQPNESEPIYKLTPLSHILIQDGAPTPYDMSELLRIVARPSTAVSTFFSLEAWFRDASSMTLFEMAHGVHPWTLTKNDASYNKAVNDAMVMDSRILMDIMLKEVNGTEIFGRLTSMIDVGGGHGVAAKAISRAFPHIKCTVLDLEQVISEAPSDGTVEFITGDMFEYIPPADAVFLKCKRAIPSRDAGGKVIIVNVVLGHGAQDHAILETQVLFDVYMMRYGGAQREEHEWRKIFLEAGFSDYKITPILGFQSIIEEEESIQNLHQGYVELWHHGLVHIKPSALLCVVRLGIPSSIHRRGGAATIPDIVIDTGVHPSKLAYLRRLMRMLSFCGVFTSEQPNESEPIYKLTPLSHIHVLDGAPTPYDMSELLRIVARPSTAVSTFFSLEAWFRDASSMTLFEMAHGVHPWTLTKNDASYNKAVNDAMVMDSRILMDIMLKEVNGTEIFGGLTSMIDVGGGHGVAAKAISRAFPHIKCTVLDLEQVISEAPSDGTVEFITGDMFEYIPPADAVFLKLIFDCWDDDDSVKILKQCKRAIPSRDAGGKVIIVNVVLGHGAQDHAILETQVLFDVYMMRYGGAQREEHEWRKIFLEVGFSDYKITPILGFQSIIEVFP